MAHLFREGRIDFGPRSQGLRLGLVLVVGIPAVMVSLNVTRIALAARLARRAQVEDLQQAIALDPGNAAYYDKLGLVYAYSFDQGNPRDAVKLLRKATELDPRQALYWADLAQVCDALNDTACSNSAIEQALRLSPMAPRFEWRAGNHYLQTGEISEAMDHFRRLLTLDHGYAQPVFRISFNAVGNLETVYQRVLPSHTGLPLKLAFLDFAIARGDVDFANQVWKQVSSAGLSCKFTEVEPYLDHLINSNDIEQARKVWTALEQADVIAKAADQERSNLVYDGGFGHPPLNAGFGWHNPDTPYVETDFRDPSGYHRSHCLRVDYAAGQNLESEPVYELVPVEPQQAYRLRAWVRSDHITSDSGPRLRVVDAQCPTCLDVSTVTTIGTTSWHPVSLNFTTGPKTRLIRLSVWRPRSRTFPMEISGSFWLDDVSIVALKSASEGTASVR